MIIMAIETATFAMGCFWHVQQLFDNTKGVVGTRVGYMGGDEKKYPNHAYGDVCTDKTGYAEVCEIEYDNSIVEYTKLLELFWENHNPTTLNKQGPDEGTQYRSVIFYHDGGQKKLAEERLNERQKRLDKKIVTKIEKAKTFFPAEEYHQKYKNKNAVCAI